MKLKNGVILTEAGEGFVAVDSGMVGTRFNGMIKMNSTAAFVAKLLREETTVEQIVEKMCEHYEVSAEDAKTNAMRVIEKLKQAGLVEDE